MRKLGDTITLDFTTHNPSTGMVQDGDALPTCEVFEDDNNDTALEPVVSKRTGKTGNYRVSIEASAINGFDVGKTYNVIASATVNSISAKSRIGIFVLDSKRNSDMNDLSASQVRSEVDSEFTERGYSAERAGLLDNLDVEVSTRALETGGNIDDIKTELDLVKTETDKITDVKAKTDLINWADITSIKTKTDTIDWSNVLAIKTKTDTVYWTDIDSIITMSGDIKDKTDTIDWNNVLAIKTKTDTILWTDITAIKTEEDLIKIETDKIQTEILDKKDEYKADVSGSALETTVQLIKIETDKIQTEILDKKDEYKADVGFLALQATVESLDLELDGVAKESTLNTKASQASVDLIKSKTDKLDGMETKIDAIIDETEHINPTILDELDKIKSKTDKLTFKGNKVDAEIELSKEEHRKIMSIPDIQFTSYIRNKRYLEKTGTTWFIVVRNDDDNDDILRKALKDKNGDDISDIAVGIMAQEMQSVV